MLTSLRCRFAPHIRGRWRSPRGAARTCAGKPIEATSETAHAGVAPTFREGSSEARARVGATAAIDDALGPSRPPRALGLPREGHPAQETRSPDG